MLKAGPFEFFKTINKAGDDIPRPSEFSKCRILLKVNESVHDEASSDVGYATDVETDITLGLASHYMSSAIDLCVQTMTHGEVSVFRIKYYMPSDKSTNTSSAEGATARNGSVPDILERDSKCIDAESILVKPVEMDLHSSTVSNELCNNADLGTNHHLSPVSGKLCNNAELNNTHKYVSSGVDCGFEGTFRLLEVEITLVSFELSSDVHNLMADEQFQRAGLLKDIGVECFKRSEISTAFYKFSRSLKYLICCDVKNVSDRVSYERLMSQCYANLAACQLKASNFVAVKENASRCLKIDPDNVKGLFRRAQASLELGDYELAVNDLEHASRLEPGNKTMAKSLMDAKTKLKLSEEKLRQAMSRMFQ